MFYIYFYSGFMMKKILLPLSFLAISSAYAFDYSVGDIVCYDRVGPWDTVGTVVSIGSKEVELKLENGKTKSYKKKKIKSPRTCKVKSEAQKYLLDKAMESIQN